MEGYSSGQNKRTVMQPAEQPRITHVEIYIRYLLPAFYDGHFTVDEMTGHFVCMRYTGKACNIVGERREG
jgi:hypothetical protein